MFTDGDDSLTEKQIEKLANQDITVNSHKITGIKQNSDSSLILTFENKTSFACEAIFTHPPCALRHELIKQLGCETTKCGTQLVIDDTGKTSIDGVYAAGDAAEKFSLIAIAAASGVTTAMTVNQDLIREGLVEEIREAKNEKDAK